MLIPVKSQQRVKFSFSVTKKFFSTCNCAAFCFVAKAVEIGRQSNYNVIRSWCRIIPIF